MSLIVLCVGMLMIVLDATVVNVALPAIQDSLGFTQAGLAWVVNAYLIAFGGLLLLAGRLGDLLSRRGVFVAGLAVFTAASVACGLAQNQAMLVAARFVQGVGGAMTSAVILGMIVTMFPGPREQARAIGVYSFVAAAGGSVGLLAGGVLTQLTSWHWIFFINIPIGLVTGIAAVRVLPADDRSRARTGLDLPGAILITAALMVGVGTIVTPTGRYALPLAGAAVLLLAGFLVREATARNPLVPLPIFRSGTVSGANAVQALTMAGMFGVFFLGALYVQHLLGYDALGTGLAFLPTTTIIGILSLRYAERFITRFGARTVLVPGLVLIAAGLALFARVPVHGSYATDVLPTMLLIGTGIGVSGPALATLAMSGATTEDAGLASGLVNTTTQVGSALGLAVLATLSAVRTHVAEAAGTPHPDALAAGYRLAFWCAAGLVVLAIGLALVTLRPRRAAATAPAEQPEYATAGL
ncbi:DHA2 family efflux MFS transporter permease subunit [Actinocatenispora rupis]|uniref:MFS transporter n=2 Tax=Actinocatenispora rupis TaxID=519421 RepID=A0A8J3J3U8_9ACTN|nr:MFS transporter [Actinocatenispora rupis]